MCKNIFRILLLIFILTGLALPCRSQECPESVSDLAEMLIKKASKEDCNAINSLIYPGTVEYYKINNRIFTMNTVIKSTFADVYGKNYDEINEITVKRVTPAEDIVTSERELEVLPQLNYSPFEAEVHFKYRGRQLGIAFFAAKKDGCYYMLIPDVTELWGIDSIKPNILKCAKVFA